MENKSNARQLLTVPLPQTATTTEIVGSGLTFLEVANLNGYAKYKIQMCVDGKDIEVSAFVHRTDLQKVGLI